MGHMWNVAAHATHTLHTHPSTSLLGCWASRPSRPKGCCLAVKSTSFPVYQPTSRLKLSRAGIPFTKYDSLPTSLPVDRVCQDWMLTCKCQVLQSTGRMPGIAVYWSTGLLGTDTQCAHQNTK